MESTPATNQQEYPSSQRRDCNQCNRTPNQTEEWMDPNTMDPRPPTERDIQPCIHIGNFNQFIIRQITRTIRLRVKHIQILTGRKQDVWQVHHISTTRLSGNTNRHERRHKNRAVALQQQRDTTSWKTKVSLQKNPCITRPLVCRPDAKSPRLSCLLSQAAAAADLNITNIKSAALLESDQMRKGVCVQFTPKNPAPKPTHR